MLVCANAEVKRVLGEREGRRDGRRERAVMLVGRIVTKGHKEPGFRFTKT